MPRLRPRMFAHMRVVHLGPTELKVDLQIVDEGGVCLVEVRGLTARQAAHRPQAFGNALYEYQWKLAPREAARTGRYSHHLPSPEELAPVVQEEGESLRQRFNRARFQKRIPIAVAGGRGRLHRARVA